mmetsp:Transcript_30684/g.60222  ORF Transcript_30684/g.60222 Transcript_30684/m.60222 type:complete len:373 (-) Transcript_30684:80-1198(-)
MGASGSSRESEPRCFSGLTTRRQAEPICVAISGAAGQIGYSLLPMIAEGAMFGPRRSVVLRCLDLNLPTVKGQMQAIEMELQDGHFDLLQEAVFTTDDSTAFKDADYAILLGAYPQQEGKEKGETMEKNSMIFRTIGAAIERYAKKGCKVLVVGHPACTNTLLCAHHTPALPKENFFALSRLDTNRAVSQIATRAQVSAGAVRNIIAWGAHNQVPDIDHATIDGKPVPEVLSKEDDREWLAGPFIEAVQRRGANVVAARKASSALSAARAIVDTIRDLHGGTKSGEIVSLGVWSQGEEYGVGAGLIFSLPVHCPGEGRFRIVPDLAVTEQTRARMLAAEADLKADRELLMEVLKKHNPDAASTAAKNAEGRL